jgi:hypothetical protein
LIDKRRHSNIVEVRYFRGADSYTDHYLVVAKVRQGLSVDKEAAQKLNDVTAKEEYQVKIKIGLQLCKSWMMMMMMMMMWASIGLGKENIKASATESIGF